MRKRILVKGYFKGNLGDDLFLKVLADRYPNETFEILVDPTVVSYYMSLKNVKIVKKNIWFKIVNKLTNIFSDGGIYTVLLRRYKAVVEIGGSIFPEKKRARSVNTERLYLSKRMKHYFVIGSNFGPYETQEFLDSYRQFFSSIEGVVFRDTMSQKLFESLNNVRYAPDVVLGLENEVKKNTENPYVAVSVIDLLYTDISRNSALKKHAEYYENIILEALVQLVDKGFDVKFVPFSKLQNDILISNKLKQKLLTLRENANVDILEEYSTESILEVIKDSSYLLSTRYHAMILGWVYGIKQQVLSYSDKTENVISDLFPQQYHYVIGSGDKYSFDIEKMNTAQPIEELNTRAREQFYYLDRYLYKDSVEGINE